MATDLSSKTAVKEKDEENQKMKEKEVADAAKPLKKKSKGSCCSIRKCFRFLCCNGCSSKPERQPQVDNASTVSLYSQDVEDFIEEELRKLSEERIAAEKQN